MIAQIAEFVVTAIGTFLTASVQGKFAIMGGVLLVASLLWNARLVVKGKVKPAPVSWFIWGSLDVIAAAGMWATDTLNFQMAAAALGAPPFFVLTLFYGKPSWSAADGWCLAAGIGAIGLWFMTGNPTLAIGLVLFAIAAGCWPTCESIAEDRSREDKTFWCLALAASVSALIGTTSMTFEALAQPIIFVLCQLVVLWFLFRPEPKVQKA